MSEKIKWFVLNSGPKNKNKKSSRGNASCPDLEVRGDVVLPVADPQGDPPEVRPEVPEGDPAGVDVRLGELDDRVGRVGGEEEVPVGDAVVGDGDVVRPASMERKGGGKVFPDTPS